ncbi:MAG TPA: hypothetical protein VGP11_01425 [Acidimicrobiales bacterium]|jgi:hypothetical protein|nr:hypothetical protein [Acidimicrobiales bacterium]
MTSEHGSARAVHVACATCSEENKLGSRRCARCGAVLPAVEGAKIDPELRNFNIAQAKLAEQIQRERRRTVMIDILTSGGPLLGQR